MKIVIEPFERNISINSKPFSPFIILSPNHQKILYFTQVFAQLSGLHPSTSPITISTSVIKNLGLDFQYHSSIDCYEIHQFKQSPPFFYEDLWVEELIHELRTASLTVDLGAHVLAGSTDQASILLQKLLQASHRQRISTLIASDFLQLQTTSPIIRTISLLKILTSSLAHSPYTSQVRFIISSSINVDTLGYINPIIWGNFFFLSNFFTTLYSWLKTKPIIMEMTSINPVSVQIIISIPEDQFLSDIQGFSLLPHYLYFIAAYFNGCAWLTQNAINILFPLALPEKAH
ncbi:MAG: hypothetical protein ACFFC6_01445 [Promethearchaeota archaeon]